MLIDLMFPSKYLKAVEFQGKDVTMTIASVALEDLQEQGGGTKRKGVVAFKERPKGLVLNRTNAECIAAMFGRETGGWAGKRITMHAVKMRDSFTGGETMAIRIKGSPDLDGHKDAEVRLPRKNPIRVRLLKTGPGAPPPESAPNPETGEVPFGDAEALP